jgi:hypothetical protein
MLERLRQAMLPPEHERRLYALIVAIFTAAIDARSPTNRPPGKAGLRAEKGYYRLLYLDGELRSELISPDEVDPEAPTYHWDYLSELLRQLADIPELRSEILAGLESALDEVIGQQPPAGS